MKKGDRLLFSKKSSLSPFFFKKETGYRIFFVVAGFLLGLAVLEGILRLGLLENKTYTRNLTDGVKKNPSYKILVLGDSFIDKWDPTRSPYPLLLKDLAPYKAQALNLGEGGLGPVDYLIEMQARGVRYRPGIVLLSYYVGNDLSNVQYRNGTGLRDRLREFLRPFLARLYIYKFYQDKTAHLFAHLSFKFHRRQRGEASLSEVRAREKGLINPWYYELSRKHNRFVLDNLLIETEAGQKAWEKARGSLREIHRLSRKNRADFLIVIFPSSLQVDRSHLPFFRKVNFKLDPRVFTSERPQALLNQFCQEEGIPCLDLLPAFRAHRGDPALYTPNDEHLNPEGCAFSERLILQFLREHSRLGR